MKDVVYQYLYFVFRYDPAFILITVRSSRCRGFAGVKRLLKNVMKLQTELVDDESGKDLKKLVAIGAWKLGKSDLQWPEINKVIHLARVRRRFWQATLYCFVDVIPACLRIIYPDVVRYFCSMVEIQKLQQMPRQNTEDQNKRKTSLRESLINVYKRISLSGLK